MSRWMIAVWILVGSSVAQGAETYQFSVLNQRAPGQIAKYWNPILEYLSKKSGVTLKLKIGKTAPETTALTVKGEAQFAFTNHLFTPERDKLGWKVLARYETAALSGEIVVPEESPVRTLKDLEGNTVGFPSKEAFAGYWLPMDELIRKQINLTPVFAGNQEALMAQLRAGKLVAAGVSGNVMKGYAEKEGLKYRVLWKSQPYPDLAIMAGPSVPAATAKAVKDAFVGMKADPEGRQLLAQQAEFAKLKPDVGFVEADDAEYLPYREFYKSTRVKD